MKKILFVAFMVVAASMVSCGGKCGSSDAAVDSTSVDTTVVDSLAVDSAVVAE